MCLPSPRGPPPASRGKSPPSSSSSSASGSSSDAPQSSSRKHRRRNSNSASTESDLPSSRIVAGHGRPQPLRSSAPPSRKNSTRKSSRTSSVAGNGSVAGLPSRKPSTRGARDPTRLAPGSPQFAPRSPAFSTKSEKPSRSPSKKQHSATVTRSSSRRKRSEAQSTEQTPAVTPRTPAAAFEKKGKKSTGEMNERDQIITMRAPLQGGGMMSGLMVIQSGSSRRGSESGSSRSKSSSRRSESRDGKHERPGSGSSSKATTLVAGPVGLGISLEDSRTPTPTSKAKVERVREVEPKQQQVPKISVVAPSPEIQKQVSKPPAPAPAAPVPAPKPPVISISPPKASPVTTYPIMATLVYPTKEELAYQPISRYQVTSKTPLTKTNIPPPAPPAPSIVMRGTVPVLDPASAAAARLPPSMLQYHNPFDTSPASSVRGLPLRGGGTPSLSQQSSMSSLASASSSSSGVSEAAISIKEPEQPPSIMQHISYVVNSVISPNSSASSLVSASSASTSSTDQSFRSASPHATAPQVAVPELSSRKPNYYRYTAPQDIAPKPRKAIMDSPRPPAMGRRAGAWDGMPGADPHLGAYYRNAAAAVKRQPAPTSEPSKPKDTPVDEANLAAYYLQAEVQKRKLALEKMKHEQSETDDETSASEVSGVSSVPWVDPSLSNYYRAAEAAKKKKDQEEITKATLSPDKALTVSPTKELPTRIIAGRKVFFSGLRRSMPQVFHAPPPPPAPTPPPGGDATSAIGEDDGPPEGAAESWFKANMAAGSGGAKPAEFWTSPSESTLPGTGTEEEFPPNAPPPAPTPPFEREEPAGGQPSPGYFARSPRKGYSYH